jgi:hypothetical protein
VLFVFEGPGTEGLVRDLVNDPTRSAAFSIWAPLLEGTPVLAREEFYWEGGQRQWPAASRRRTPAAVLRRRSPRSSASPPGPSKSDTHIRGQLLTASSR